MKSLLCFVVYLSWTHSCILTCFRPGPAHTPHHHHHHHHQGFGPIPQESGDTDAQTSHVSISWMNWSPFLLCLVVHLSRDHKCILICFRGARSRSQPPLTNLTRVLTNFAGTSGYRRAKHSREFLMNVPNEYMHIISLARTCEWFPRIQACSASYCFLSVGRLWCAKSFLGSYCAGKI